MTDEGWAWLRDQLTSTETVWFRLIRRDNDTLDCLVSLGRVSVGGGGCVVRALFSRCRHILVKSNMRASAAPPPAPHIQGVAFGTCVNEELLRLGLGRTVPVAGLHHGSRLYWRVHRRLLRAEVQAERKGRGLWVQESFWKRLAGALGDSAVARLLKKLLRRT